MTNVLVHAPSDWDPAQPVRALSIDQWTDVVPHRKKIVTEDGTFVEDRRASGVAVNAASASSRPPQSVLLAVSPDGKRWTTDRLIDVLRETLELARIRAVTLESVPGVGRVLPALYLPAWSIKNEKVFDFRYPAKHANIPSALAFVKEPK